jgi:hypothetical protein
MFAAARNEVEKGLIILRYPDPKKPRQALLQASFIQLNSSF